MWPNPQFPADLVPFSEEILNGMQCAWAIKISVWKEQLTGININQSYQQKGLTNI